MDLELPGLRRLLLDEIGHTLTHTSVRVPHAPLLCGLCGGPCEGAHFVPLLERVGVLVGWTTALWALTLIGWIALPTALGLCARCHARCADDGSGCTDELCAGRLPWHLWRRLRRLLGGASHTSTSTSTRGVVVEMMARSVNAAGGDVSADNGEHSPSHRVPGQEPPDTPQPPQAELEVTSPSSTTTGRRL